MTVLPRLTLVLGGARSGKSRHAEEIVQALPPPWTYIATGQAFDDEMRTRIAGGPARELVRCKLDASQLAVVAHTEIAGDAERAKRRFGGFHAAQTLDRDGGAVRQARRETGRRRLLGRGQPPRARPFTNLGF